jgi:hypothetical protein
VGLIFFEELDENRTLVAVASGMQSWPDHLRQAVARCHYGVIGVPAVWRWDEWLRAVLVVTFAGGFCARWVGTLYVIAKRRVVRWRTCVVRRSGKTPPRARDLGLKKAGRIPAGLVSPGVDRAHHR